MKCLVLVKLALAVLACGPKSGSGSDPAVPVLPDVPFEQLDHDQKIQFMKQVVVPAMGPIFKRHDPGRYGGFGCVTCHGEAADRGEYHMPNDGLPRLNFADLSKFRPHTIEWMKNEVKPTMARLLREPEHTEDNPDGFGCLGCHVAVGQ
jgi:hypothetical protein